MSYFLCLAVPQEVSDLIPAVFDQRIHQTDATNMPIGITTRGTKRAWLATILQIGSSSASLIGKGGVRRTHNNDHTGLLMSGIQALLANEDCNSVSFLAHWMHGYITEEQIHLHSEKILELPALTQAFSELQEDVRYTVFRRVPVDGEDLVQ